MKDGFPKADVVVVVPDGANMAVADREPEVVDGVPNAPVNIDDPNVLVDVEASNELPKTNVEPKLLVAGPPNRPADEDEPNARTPPRFVDEGDDVDTFDAAAGPSELYWLQAVSYNFCTL